MVKAGKRVKRQIRKNKKKPTVQVAKKRMNVREIMLEKMKMGMLVPQQQMTPQQQQQQYNEMDRLRNKNNVAEKGLSDERQKRKALEVQYERTKEEKDEEMRVRKEQDEKLRKLKEEYKKKLKEYERDKQFNETVDALNEKQEDLDQQIQDDQTIGAKEKDYNKRKKDFERKQAEQKRGDEFFEKNDELEYKISQAKDDSEAMEMKKHLADLKNQYEIITHATAKKQSEIDKNKLLTKIQIQEDKNKQAEAELRALDETLNSKAYTNSLEAYKESCKKNLQLQDDIRLKNQQLENEKQIMAEQMKYEAQREYWYGTEQQRRQRGFISDGQRAENKLQASIVRQMNAITSLKIQNNDVVYRAEQLNAFEDQLEGATRNKAKLEAEQWRAKAMVKENKDKFDENGNLILTEEEKKTFEDEAKAKTNLELENERIKGAKQKIALSKEQAKEEAYNEQLNNEEYINQIKDIQVKTENMKHEEETQKLRNELLEQQKQMKIKRSYEEARNKTMEVVGNRQARTIGLFNEQIEYNKVFLKTLDKESNEYHKLVDNLGPFMKMINSDENNKEILLNSLNEYNPGWTMENIENWTDIKNDSLKELTAVAIKSGAENVLPYDELMKI